MRLIRLTAGASVVLAVCCSSRASAQTREETLAGPDAHEHAEGDRGHLSGDWAGERTRLLERGVKIDLQYISDTLSNIRSDRKMRLTSWNRVRGTVDLDLEPLVGAKDLYIHMTGLWQGGGNLGTYLGLISSPSGMSSGNTFRLDSWWVEKRLAHERVALRVGQFAGQDFYGAQHDAVSYVFEPMGYALSNLSNTYEVYDPPSTPAAEVRVVVLPHVYVKSMVMAGDRAPYSHNPTGFVPQFKGAPVVVDEVAWTPGKKASSLRAFDNVEERRGYSGLYQLGSAYNPGKFAQAGSVVPRSGNYLIYAMASQAIFRSADDSDRGVDLTAAYDWSPAEANAHDRLLTAGVRLNGPIPMRRHNTFAIGYVRTNFSDSFPVRPIAPLKAEHGVELNLLVDATKSLMLQPVLQYYANAGGGGKSAAVFGFRTKIDF